MQREMTKPVKEELATLAGKAHEAALRRMLEQLALAVDRWRRGEIDSFDLSDRIHQFHDGPNRDIYKRYTYTSNSGLPVVVAYAIAEGLVDKASLSPEARALVDPLIEFWSHTE